MAIAAGAVSELVVLGGIGGSVRWATPLVIAVCVLSVIALSLRLSARLRAVALGAALAVLLAAPAAWAFDTLGHATSSTFPAGGPENAGSPGGFGGVGGARRGSFPGGRFGGAPGSRSSGGGFPGPGRGSFGPGGGSAGGPGGGTSGRGGALGGSSGGGPSFGANSTELTAAARYARSHGGGTVGVESQSSAASAIIAGQDNVAGLGGFSGVESAVSVRWLATEVRDGHLRWLLADSTSIGGFGGGSFGRSRSFGGGSNPFGGGTSPFGGGASPFGGGANPFGGRRSGGRGGFSDGRTGSEKAFAIAEKVARKVTITENGTTVTLYDLKGRAAAILAAADSTSGSSSASQTA